MGPTEIRLVRHVNHAAGLRRQLTRKRKKRGLVCDRGGAVPLPTLRLPDCLPGTFRLLLVLIHCRRRVSRERLFLRSVQFQIFLHSLLLCLKDRKCLLGFFSPSFHNAAFICDSYLVAEKVDKRAETDAFQRKGN